MNLLRRIRRLLRGQRGRLLDLYNDLPAAARAQVAEPITGNNWLI